MHNITFQNILFKKDVQDVQNIGYCTGYYLKMEAGHKRSCSGAHSQGEGVGWWCDKQSSQGDKLTHAAGTWEPVIFMSLCRVFYSAFPMLLCEWRRHKDEKWFHTTGIWTGNECITLHEQMESQLEWKYCILYFCKSFKMFCMYIQTLYVFYWIF